MVRVVHVEIAGQRQANSFLITAGESGKPREVTVGRPPAKVDTRPDIVVPDKSVSKIHAVLWVRIDNDDAGPSNRLVVSDRSRYGTTVNGKKMAEGDSQELSAGDVLQLAPKIFLIVEEMPLVLAVHPAHPQLADVRKVAAAAGAVVVHAYDESITHILYDPGDAAWSALVQGVMRGTPLAGLGWLQQIASAGILVDALPSPPHISELLLGPARPPTRVPLPAPAVHGGIFDGVTFGYSSAWEDSGLPGLLTELGARVARGPLQGAQVAVDVVLTGLYDGGSSAARGTLSTEQLLTSILALDVASVRQLVLAASAQRTGAQSAAATAPTQHALEEDQADSDMTQAAEDDEEAQGEAVEQRRPASRIEEQSRALTATLSDRVGAVAARLSEARVGDAAPVQEGDGWMVAARRPEESALQASITISAQFNHTRQQPEADGVHEDAPAPKRRRLGTAVVAPIDTGTSVATATTHRANPFSRAPATTVEAPWPSSSLPGVATKHEPVEDAPWMTQHPHGHNARRSSAGLRTATPAAATLVAVKAEPVAAPPSTAPGPAKGKGRKTAKSAADVDDLTLGGRIKSEEPPVPEVLDASAQVVLEADLFAPTPEQQLPPRCRSDSAEPYASGRGGGDGCSSSMMAADLPDFKQFRKQGAQMQPTAVKPLPVFLVDNFQRMEDVEAFLRAEEERVSNKRHADEMFKNAEKGSKRAARAPRRT